MEGSLSRIIGVLCMAYPLNNGVRVYVNFVLKSVAAPHTYLASPFLQPFGGSVHHAQASSWTSVPLVPLLPLVPPAPRRWSFRVVCAPTRRVGLYGKWSFDRIRLRRWSAAWE